jgi:hypothetical protein
MLTILTSATAGLVQDGLVAEMAWFGSFQGLAFERVLLQLSRLKHKKKPNVN